MGGDPPPRSLRSLRLAAPFLQGPIAGIIGADLARSQWGPIPPAQLAPRGAVSSGPYCGHY